MGKMRALHKQEIMKQKIYYNIPARQSGMGYSPGIQFENFLSTRTNQKHTPREINWGNWIRNSKDVACVATSNTCEITLKDIPGGGSYLKAKNLALGMGQYQVETNKASKSISSRGRVNMYVGRGGWGGWKIRQWDIISKCGIKCGFWGIWGNWGWVFLGRLVLSVRSVNLGMYWDIFYSLDILWRYCWGSLQRRLCIVLVRSIFLVEVGFLCAD